jgi:hypothetical protein
MSLAPFPAGASSAPGAPPAKVTLPALAER